MLILSFISTHILFETGRREVLAELWPNAPAECWISASFVRSFSEDALPAQVQAQSWHRADLRCLLPRPR